MATPESKAKSRLYRLLKKYNCYYTMAVTGGYGRSGAADVSGCSDGRYFGVEVKADTKVTALQQKNLDDIVSAGGRAFVVRKKSDGTEYGYDELELFLKEGLL